IQAMALTVEVLPDFSEEEKAFLSDERSQLALARAGVDLEQLRPRPPLPSSSRTLQVEERRLYLWRLVRAEFENLPAPVGERQGEKESSSPSSPPSSSVVRRELALASCALRRQWETSHRQLELAQRQASAEEVRAELARQRAREQVVRREKMQMRAQMRHARLAAMASAAESRALAGQGEGSTIVGEGKSGARRGPAGSAVSKHHSPAGRARTSRWSAMAEAARERRASLDRLREEELAVRLVSKERGAEERREQLVYEVRRKKVLGEAIRLRHEEQRLAGEAIELERRLALQAQVARRQQMAEAAAARRKHGVEVVPHLGGARSGAVSRESEGGSRVEERAEQRSKRERIEERQLAEVQIVVGGWEGKRKRRDAGGGAMACGAANSAFACAAGDGIAREDGGQVAGEIGKPSLTE
ncbi:MAG: hypothetical protein SGPRY_007003, partial [Prymnesium sp.]